MKGIIMNNSINNSPINFQAKMTLYNDLAQNVRLQKIAKEFEAKTQKRFPQYEIGLQRPEDLSHDKLEIAIDRGISDDLSVRFHVLTPNATEKFMKLSDNQIIQKLTKLLGMVKKRDNVWEKFSSDVRKVEKKYGIEFNQETYDMMFDDAIDQVCLINHEKLSKDTILSDFVESHHIVD